MGTNQVRARLGLPPVAGIARGFTSQGPASLPANAESMPVYQGTAMGRVGSPTARADSPGGGRVLGGYNYNARRTEPPLPLPDDLQGASRIPRPGQQPAGGGGVRKAVPRGHRQGLAPPSQSVGSASGVGSWISDAPNFEMDGKASYYAPGMQIDSREHSVYDPPVGRGVNSGAHERDVRSEWTESMYDDQSEYSTRDSRYQPQRNGYGNSKFPPMPVRNAGGRIPSQDRDLPPPPPPQEDDEEEFEVIGDAEDDNGFPDIPTPTAALVLPPAPLPPASLSSGGSPPPVPRKSADSYGRNGHAYGHGRTESALSSDSGLGLPRESTDTDNATTGGGMMQSTLFRTEAQELRARWTAQEREKDEREREWEHQRPTRSAARPPGGYFDRRKENIASSEVQTPVSAGSAGSVGHDRLYMSDGDMGSPYGGGGASRRRRGHTKSMIAREREKEEQDMARAAAELSARKRWEKEQQLMEETEEEERKKVG